MNIKHVFYKRTVRMFDDLSYHGLSSGPHFAIQAFDQVEAACEELPSPTLITQAVVPEGCAGEWRKWLRGITDETTRRVGIETKHKRDK